MNKIKVGLNNIELFFIIIKVAMNKVKVRLECLNRFLNKYKKCSSCVRDYEEGHINNSDCPDYMPVRMRVVEVNEVNEVIKKY